jgi:hypothetical protein
MSLLSSKSEPALVRGSIGLMHSVCHLEGPAQGRTKTGVLRIRGQKNGSGVGPNPSGARKGSGWKNRGVRGCGQLRGETVGVCRESTVFGQDGK